MCSMRFFEGMKHADRRRDRKGDDALRITVINVGYGDAILFQSTDGHAVLLDGGSALPQEFQNDPYRIPAAEYLKAIGVERLDAVIVSHIHEDHVCGLEAVFQQASVGKIFVPYPTAPFLTGRELQAGDGAPRSVPLYTAALNAYGRILRKAVSRNIPVEQVRPGDTIQAAPGLRIRVLAPKPASIARYMELVEKAYASQGDVTDLLQKLDATSNQTSLLLRAEADGIVFLTAADSCPSQWDEVPKNLLEDANVLKLPHHGQRDAISEQFMRNMPLSYVITTASSDRRYNSANQEVYQTMTAWHPEGDAPEFLFSDERSYPPYFSQPGGFQAITLEVDSGAITPGFMRIPKNSEKGEKR